MIIKAEYNLADQPSDTKPTLFKIVMSEREAGQCYERVCNVLFYHKIAIASHSRSFETGRLTIGFRKSRQKACEKLLHATGEWTINGLQYGKLNAVKCIEFYRFQVAEVCGSRSALASESMRVQEWRLPEEETQQ